MLKEKKKKLSVEEFCFVFLNREMMVNGKVATLGATNHFLVFRV
jgi:hypothetical protein